jgi:hypothetical protein
VNPKITDEGVTRLPLRKGRAELLEEIMAIPTQNERGPARSADELGARRRTRWLPVAGAAAAVAAIAAAVAVPTLLADDDKTVTEAPVAAPGNGEIAVLDDAGWTLTYASIDDEYGGELSYEAVDQGIDTTPGNDWGVTLDIHWRPADQYDSYVADRAEIGAGEDVDVLGAPALLWSYSGDDHTTIREVVGDFSLEVRGTGMSRQDYLGLLDRLTAIAPADLDAHLPEDFVTAGERAEVVAAMLEGIPLPRGFDPEIASEEVERYQLGADVTSAVACAWIGEFAEAKRAGDDAGMREAQDAMGTARDWPILVELAPEGGWSDVIWQYADAVSSGKVPAGYKMGIGCE